jgi:hypothetical protein
MVQMHVFYACTQGSGPVGYLPGPLAGRVAELAVAEVIAALLGHALGVAVTVAEPRQIADADRAAVACRARAQPSSVLLAAQASHNGAVLRS